LKSSAKPKTTIFAARRPLTTISWLGILTPNITSAGSQPQFSIFHHQSHKRKIMATGLFGVVTALLLVLGLGAYGSDAVNCA
jgi:hypothetical protein